MFEVSEMAGGAHAPLNSTSITIKYQKDVSYAHSNVATVACSDLSFSEYWDTVGCDRLSIVI